MFFKRYAGICVGTLIGLSIMATNRVSAQPLTTDLEIQVGAFRNTTGQLACLLFGDSKGFPRKTELARSSQTSRINGQTGSCFFKGLPAGTYAVAVMHDENKNEILDTNLLGSPTEGYGVSNNNTYALSSPVWEESRFELSSVGATKLTIKLRY